MYLYRALNDNDLSTLNLNEELQQDNQAKDAELEQLRKENVEHREKEDKILELLKH